MYQDLVLQRLDELNEKLDTLLETLKVTPGTESEWVTKKVAMKMLNCSERTLQTLRDNGSLPHSSPFGGSKFSYKRSDILKLLESGYTGCSSKRILKVSNLV
jgi:hypothetical protein